MIFARRSNSCDRARCGTVAPAEGLYFVAVDYEDCTPAGMD